MRGRKRWVTPHVATRLVRQVVEHPELLENAEARQIVAELQELERKLRRLDDRASDDRVRARMRSDMLLGMARGWSRLNRYLGD
ncbi:MAG TPA: hypothetical protein VD788_17810 [Candidatus Polarisedimenticolaceae bacterium]|nr:hypothetical protein [Candidatus Polarisedimenticolaceae bacterium]